jgi:microcin C transport system permease protein
MTTYIIRRLLLMIPTFLAITLIVSAICRNVPGGPIEQAKMAKIMAGVNNEKGKSPMSSQDLSNKVDKNELSEEDLKMLKAHYGISDSFVADYFQWLGNTFVGDFGKSNRYNDSVSSMIYSRIPISLFYGLLSMFIVYGICIPLGIVKALKNMTFIDSVTSLVVFIGYAIPGYALGAILIVFASAQWGWFPIGGFLSDNFETLSFFEKVFDLFHHGFLPLCCYLVGSFAFMTMLVKNTMLENMSADYIRTALAKGVPYKKAVFKHAFDNSLIPLATHFGNNISLLIGGSFLIEQVFNIDGVGLLGFEAIVNRDFPIVMGILAIGCALQMMGNLLSDICVAYVDPRVKFE